LGRDVFLFEKAFDGPELLLRSQTQLKFLERPVTSQKA
jgi:hypothetical protein